MAAAAPSIFHMFGRREKNHFPPNPLANTFSRLSGLNWVSYQLSSMLRAYSATVVSLRVGDASNLPNSRTTRGVKAGLLPSIGEWLLERTHHS